MKKLQATITIRVVAAMLVTLAVVGLSTLAMPTPTENQKALGLKSIQADKATVFYADFQPDAVWFVEQVLPGTGESKAAIENLKLVAATL